LIFATVLAPYPNWSDSVGHPEFCTDKIVLKSSAIFFSRSVCTDLLNPNRHCANEEKQTEIPIDHLQK
jgi:hypothetical protein